MVEPTCRYADHGRESPRGVDCRLHRRRLCGQIRLGPHGPDNVLRVARMFVAINKCTERLRELYSGLERLPKILPGVIYPSPTADPPGSAIPQLEFFSKLDRVDGTPLSEINEDNARHGIYLARMLLRRCLHKRHVGKDRFGQVHRKVQ